MTYPLNVVEIPTLIPKKVMSKIVFASSGVSVEYLLSFNKNIFIPTENIAAFRFGVKGMHFFKFTFGQKYFIEITDYQNKTYCIKLNSYYGINRKSFLKIWVQLLEHFWNFYMVNQLDMYKELFDMKQTFELSGVTFHPDGISWNEDNKLRWNEITVSSYQTHFMIHHIDDISQSKCCVFSVHWNAVVLQSLLNHIINQPKKVRKSTWL